MGKNGKPVPILITKDVKEAVELLNTTRSQAFPENKKSIYVLHRRVWYYERLQSDARSRKVGWLCEP